MSTIHQHCRDLLTAAVAEGACCTLEAPRDLPSSDLTGMAALLESLLAENQTVDVEKLRGVLMKPCPPVYAYDFESYDKAWRFLLAIREEVRSLLAAAAAAENGRTMAGATPGVPDGAGA